MKYGYCRISTQKQNIERQVRNITAAYPDAKIVTEVYTGRTLARPKWEQLRRQLREGDTVIFDSVSRMSRSAQEGVELYKELFAAGVALVFLKEPYINTETYKESLNKQIGTITATGDSDTDELLNKIRDALNVYMMRLAEKQIAQAFEQSEKEVQDLRQRVREGLITAKANGKQVGKEKGNTFTTKKSAAAKEIIKQHCKAFGGSLNDADTMKLCGIARNSYYKYKRELLEEVNA